MGLNICAVKSNIAKLSTVITCLMRHEKTLPTKFILPFYFLFLAGTLHAQIQKFDYKVENDSPFDRFNFTSTRTFLNDTIFADSGILCSEDTAVSCAITFKKIETTWYVKADGQWQEFFSPVDSLIKVIYFKNEKYILKPIRQSMNYNGFELYGFIKDILYVYTSDNSTLWFEPNCGVVIIEGDDDLVRQDFAKDM